jgi:hypothetical protein
VHSSHSFNGDSSNIDFMAQPNSTDDRRPPHRGARHESATDFESRLWQASRAVAIARSRAARLREMVLQGKDVNER